MADNKRTPIAGRIPDWDTPWDDGTHAYSTGQVREFLKSEITKTAVDAALDETSEHPVQNAVVTQRLNELADGVVTDMTITGDEVKTLNLIGAKNNNIIAQIDLPAMGGAVGGDATALILVPSWSARMIKSGDEAVLTYRYDLINAGDQSSTLTPADLTISVKCGATEIYHEDRRNVRPGTYTIDLTDKVQIGDNDVKIVASWEDPNTGDRRTSTRATSLRVEAFHLISQYDMAPMLENCGYDGLTEVRFRVTGALPKEVLLYVDGEQSDSQTVPRGDVAASFYVDFSELSPGEHTLQIVATMTKDEDTITSEALYIAAMRKGTAKGVGVHIINPRGVVGEGRPIIGAKTFEEVSIEYGVYDTASPLASATLCVTGESDRTLSVPRVPQTLTWRFSTTGAKIITVSAGSVTQGAGFNVADSGIDVSEKTVGLICKLSAQGRSNTEAPEERAAWSAGGVSTTFEGVDWQTSGWTGNALRLINGARAVVGYRPFATNVGQTGLTLEMTIKIANVINDSTPIIHCMDEGKGLRVQGSEIAYLTGQTVTYKDEDDNDQTREMKLTTAYQAGGRIKIAFVVEPERKVMHMYVNGNRAGADTYTAGFSFVQDSPKYITFDSAAADIEIENLRIYDHAITDDEELMNDIADSATTSEMLDRYSENNVLDDLGGIDYNKIQGRGKGTILIVRQNLLDDVYATNNKKQDFTADVYYTPPVGLGEPFAVHNCYIRIQGTSSTKYPSKNIRFYLNKGPKTEAEPLSMTIGGQPAAEGNKYRLRPDSIPVNLFTAKADYSDSTMSMNTGGARLFNDVLKELNLLTPPQRYQLEQGTDITVRAAIDGVPVDMFVARSADETPTYVGQYNLNNEKSKSEKIFGMELSGFTAECPITLESLNNLQPLCLFQSGENVQDTLDETFDDAFEFNYPEDTFWTQEGITKNENKGSLASETQRAAISRLFEWVTSCVPADADSNDISTFASAEFAAHVGDYFDVDYLLTYYLWTEFFVSVDQRSKNILWRTWDGLKWYPTYYDGDTQMGKSNDSFMSYDPDTDRNTYDSRLGQYAFQGRDSWLWNLCLANLMSDFRECAARLRAVLTPDRVKQMLLVEQAGNWSDRQYNKSGELKYITPAVTPFPIGAPSAKLWPFIFALQGANREHTKWFVDRRWSLIDAKYGIGTYTGDNIETYFSRTESDPADVVSVIGSNVYSYGYGTVNTPLMYSSGIVQPGVPADIPVTHSFNANDPVFIYGASRLRKIDLSGVNGHLKNGFDLTRCTALEELDAHVTAGSSASSGWWLANIDKCSLLRVLNLNGQSGVSTQSGSLDFDISALTRLESVDLRGTTVTGVQLPQGAAITALHLPTTLTALTLHNLPTLTAEGLSVEGYASIRSLAISGCPQLDAKNVVAEWLADEGTKQTLTLEDVDWTLTSAQLLTDIATKVSEVNITGSIDARNVYLLDDEYAALVDKFGAECFSPGGALYIRIGGTAIFTSESNPELYALFAAAGKVPVARPDQIGKMTQANAQAITKDELYNIWFNKAQNVRSFDEFRFFTGVTEIKDSTFMNSSALESITLPTSVTKIGMAAFAGCVKLHTLCSLRTTAPTVQYESAFGLGPSTGYEYTGRDVTGAKLLIVPVNATGYDSGKWTQLTAANKCGFTLSKTLV